MNLVPTASTTAALAIGDALAMTLLVEKGFRQEDFASLHPGGKLGKRLMRVEALMHGGAQCPIVKADTRMRDVIYEMSRKGLGMTCVVDGDETLLGIITDGDLRRHMERASDILTLKAADVMTRNPVSVPPSTLAAEALNIMEQRKITSIVVQDAARPARAAGVLHLHDLWRMEMF
jgi:arabinose-5-phosphate isomerase